MRWLNHERKIALTGLAGSGKTVFLLSLLQHLEHFDPDRFRIPGGGEVSAFRELPPPPGFDAFPRARLRARLIEAQDVAWPEKTRTVHRLRCSFGYRGLDIATRLWNTVSRLSWLDERVDWDILDFPGERLADALIARHGGFAGWSDELLALWDGSDGSRAAVAPYTALFAAPVPPVDAALLDAYKRALAAMAHGKNQMITPSTFMLDEDGGGVLAAEDVADGGRRRFSGLPGAEFAPLPGSFRSLNPGLAARFEVGYRQYRERVVLPLFDAINGCDTLLVLVDIPGILSGGVGRYNDTNHLLETLAGNIVPSSFFTTNVDKAALVASKADMVHARDQDSLLELATDMLRLVKNRQPGVKRYRAFVASAWVSAESVDLDDGGRALRGVPARGDGETHLFRVPELPADWPADWPAEDPRYSYPRLAPPRLVNRYQAPAQRNLERIFDFIVRG